MTALKDILFLFSIFLVLSHPVLSKKHSLSDNGISTTAFIPLINQKGSTKLGIVIEPSDKFGPLWISVVPQNGTFELGIYVSNLDNFTTDEAVYNCQSSSFLFCEVPLEWIDSLPIDPATNNTRIYTLITCESSQPDISTCQTLVTMITGVLHTVIPFHYEEGPSRERSSFTEVILTKNYPSFVNLVVEDDETIERVILASFLNSGVESYEMLGFNNGVGSIDHPDWISAPLGKNLLLPLHRNGPGFQLNHNYTVGLYPFDSLNVVLYAVSFGNVTRIKTDTFYDALSIQSKKQLRHSILAPQNFIHVAPSLRNHST